MVSLDGTVDYLLVLRGDKPMRFAYEEEYDRMVQKYAIVGRPSWWRRLWRLLKGIR